MLGSVYIRRQSVEWQTQSSDRANVGDCKSVVAWLGLSLGWLACWHVLELASLSIVVQILKQSIDHFMCVSHFRVDCQHVPNQQGTVCTPRHTHAEKKRRKKRPAPINCTVTSTHALTRRRTNQNRTCARQQVQLFCFSIVSRWAFLNSSPSLTMLVEWHGNPGH